MNHETGICCNCGADKALHHYATMQCPKGGRESPLDRKQKWMAIFFEDSGLKKLSDAAPEILEALQNSFDVLGNIEMLIQNEQKLTPIIIGNISKAIELDYKAIKKATE